MLGINVSWDKDQLARMFMGVYKVAYPVGETPAEPSVSCMDVEATPTSVFIDKAGRLVERHEGGWKRRISDSGSMRS